eukprot:NODE_3488_length_958_cov_718.267148_g3338_i0.p2 GENE.NODE_3488_length_958_cov_718.267148_g3338_i0~~NODE_3488_length_958_cov_718.267148_g3338_i0.p2  ORF type:complete len:205 (-),score=27.84 NODE_3488_length_958_cov_718.267148_g3338_i0:150-764(-)
MPSTQSAKTPQESQVQVQPAGAVSRTEEGTEWRSEDGREYRCEGPTHKIVERRSSDDRHYSYEETKTDPNSQSYYHAESYSGTPLSEAEAKEHLAKMQNRLSVFEDEMRASEKLFFDELTNAHQRLLGSRPASKRSLEGQKAEKHTSQTDEQRLIERPVDDFAGFPLFFDERLERHERMMRNHMARMREESDRIFQEMRAWRPL